MKFKKTKRFLFNSEKKYDVDEVVLNWLLAAISPFLILVFGIAFYIEMKGINYSPNDLLHLEIPKLAKTYSIIAFVGVVLLISCFIIKLIKRKKRKKLKKNEKKKGDRYYDGWKNN